MNTASIFMFQANQTSTMLSSAIIQSIPFDLVHALATIVFLFVISRPMLEKLDRIKLKYGPRMDNYLMLSNEGCGTCEACTYPE